MITYLINFLIIAIVFSQGTRKVIPGKEYEAGFVHRFFLGDHWRDLWTSQIDVDILDLDNFEGGLRAYRKGGGFQTKSLRFKAKSGKKYKFRSLNKDPKKVLDPIYRETFVADIVQDQISTSHPMSAIIVAPLLNAVNILNAEPVIVLLPDHENLGEFRSEFANLLGTLEEHPDDYDDDSLNFASSDKIKSTFDLFDKMRKSSKHRFNQEEYLKARLMDILLGDWDRHQDQWKWAGFKGNKFWTWKPIPRDRDQAFSRYDGIFPRIGARIIPQIESFDPWYPNIEDLTWSGRYVDHRVLNEITKAEWDSVTQFIYKKITDDQIIAAVNKMPKDWVNESGDFLINTLKERRDNLKKVSREYYDYIFSYVHIYCSNDEEFVEINRLNNDETEITIFDYKKKKKKKGKRLFYRIFKSSETKELRIFLDKGDDIVEIKGDVENAIDIYLVGDKGDDTYLDNSNVKSAFLGLIPNTKLRTFIYDKKKKSKLKLKESSQFIEKSPGKYRSPEERYEPKIHNYGYDWKWGSWINYNDEDGYILGTGAILYHYKLFNNPYDYRLSLLGAYSAESQSPHLEFTGKFYEWVKGYSFNLKTLYSELDFNRFYGLGNNTKILLEDEDPYYLTKQTRFLTELSVFKEFETHEYGFTIKYHHSKFSKQKGTILENLNLPGKEKLDLLGFRFTYRYEAPKKEKKFPRSGYFAEITSSYWPDINTNYEFREFSADLRAYSKLSSGIELSNRFYIDKVWGKYPFFFSRFLGSNQLLRGFARERFAGDLALLFNQEIKARLFSVKLIIPGDLGVQLFHDLGRVYYGLDDKKWHYDYGFGIWLSYFKGEIFLNPGLAFNENTERFLFQFGYSF